MKLKILENKINLVKIDMLNKFPNCRYTIQILLWDDDTDSVECRYGNEDGTKIYISKYYNNELTFEEVNIDGKVCIKNKFGNNKYLYLTEERPSILNSKKIR
jgi:hypothetical protein